MRPLNAGCVQDPVAIAPGSAWAPLLFQERHRSVNYTVHTLAIKSSAKGDYEHL